ncbi:hypothetical protein H310_10721 [Aphanomyces invadans]|uniref:FYVE-type domain-containing protein n=1 Tax=Aphanomyces invadans TaxID=157072 RepID=A0A024TPJ3_9STRA|nr:hypothetical protein H310_10721 [Aphanomyces invadans]ETV96080.1 hypothetical protein H310_10721 [Aphanomyces invadans]|eukprot:XP_008875391.1 hypothetical protein H310_10721 [Aphanomyces invadans]
MTAKLPLPRDFFRCPPLAPSDMDAFKKLARRASTELAICARRTNGPIQWTEDVHEPGLIMYSGLDTDSTGDVLTYCSVTDVNGTLDEVAAMFYATNGPSTEHSCHLAKHVLDSHHLYTVAKPTPECPRHAIYMRWMVMETPIKGLGVISPRDYCVLESHHDMEVDNRRGWIRSVVSIDLNCCPPLNQFLGFVRASIVRSGHVVMETDRPGVLEVTHLVQIDLKLHAPHWIRKLGVRARCRGVLSIDVLLREQRLSQSGSFLASSELVSKDARSACAVCEQSFGLLHHKSNCRKCGEVVCGRCSKMWRFKVSGTSEAMRICTSCALTSSTAHGAATVCSDSVVSATMTSSQSTANSPRLHRTATRSADQVVCGRNTSMLGHATKSLVDLVELDEARHVMATNVRVRAATTDCRDAGFAMLEDNKMTWRRRQQSLSTVLDPDGWST